MSRSVGIVLPAYRPDVGVLQDYVEAIAAEIDPATIRIELDDPELGVREALADLPADLHAVDRRRGKGTAITCGFEHLGTDVLAFADADGSTPVDSLAAVIAAAGDGEADLAVGSRRHPESLVGSHQGFARRRMGDGLAWLARRILEVDLYDYQCGAKAITASGWDAVRDHLRVPGFAWDIDLIAIAGALDLRVVEIPVSWEDQPGSTVSPAAATLEFTRALRAARHRAKRLRGSTVHRWLSGRWSDGPTLLDRLADRPNE